MQTNDLKASELARVGALLVVKIKGDLHCAFDPRSVGALSYTPLIHPQTRGGTQFTAQVFVETRGGATHKIPCVDIAGAKRMLQTILAEVAKASERKVTPKYIPDHSKMLMPGDEGYTVQSVFGDA
jgi:hypothetical protein